MLRTLVPNYPSTDVHFLIPTEGDFWLVRRPWVPGAGLAAPPGWGGGADISSWVAADMPSCRRLIELGGSGACKALPSWRRVRCGGGDAGASLPLRLSVQMMYFIGPGGRLFGRSGLFFKAGVAQQRKVQGKGVRNSSPVVTAALHISHINSTADLAFRLRIQSRKLTPLHGAPAALSHNHSLMRHP